MRYQLTTICASLTFFHQLQNISLLKFTLLTLYELSVMTSFELPAKFTEKTISLAKKKTRYAVTLCLHVISESKHR